MIEVLRRIFASAFAYEYTRQIRVSRFWRKIIYCIRYGKEYHAMKEVNRVGR